MQLSCIASYYITVPLNYNSLFIITNDAKNITGYPSL